MVATSQQPLTYNPESLGKILCVGWLPHTGDYATVINHFPSDNIHPPWVPLGTKGRFFATVCLYDEGKLVTKLHSACCDETGCLRFDLDDALKLLPPFSGMLVIEYHHEKKIPIELYTAHIHRQTGSYFACAINTFVGNDLYPSFRASHMDNVMFFPGLVFDEQTETSFIMVNPFHLKFPFQIHLIFGDGTKQQSEVLELKPMHLQTYQLEELFPGCRERSAAFGGRTSLCVTSQYKQAGYLVLRDRETGIVTTLDHLHNYVIY